MKQQLSKNPIPAIKEITKSSGIGGFVFGFRPDEQSVTIHFENISMKAAFSVVIAAFQQCIALELKNNPQYDSRQRGVFEDLLRDFRNIVATANAKTETVNKKEVISPL